MSQVLEPRTYRRDECAVFRKTNEAYGGLSNMAPGFPVKVNGVLILTVEALYQACRFPHMPEVQRLILEQHSPMTAKMVGKPYRDRSRPDWDRVRVKIMRWCLRLKLLMHRSSFSDLLLSTGDRPIVEDSRKDDFWGALRVNSTTLAGRNVLGRLLMELREELKQHVELRLEPPAIPIFELYRKPIGVIDFRIDKDVPVPAIATNVERAPFGPLFADSTVEVQGSRKPDNSLPRSEKRTPGMIDNLEPYAEYRKSGSPWLGNIPMHWKLPRLGSVLRERKETNEERQIEQVLSVLKGIGVIRYEDKGNIGNKRSEDTGRYKIVRPDDIVVNCMNVIIGSVGRSRYTGCLSPVYYVLTRRTETDNPRYLAAVFATKSFHESLVRIGNGILAHRMRIPMELLKCEPFPVPPANEQDAIVRFLEWANGRLDRAIRAKRKIIALLNEQKQAIIHRAVTCGLDSSVPSRPSGVSWLGDIPAGWDVLRAKYLFREVDERSSTGSEELLSVSHLTGVTPRSQKNITMFKAESYVGHKLCRPGDLVVNTMWAWMGALGTSRDTGIISPGYAVYRQRSAERLRPDFIDGLLRTRLYVDEFTRRSTGIRSSRLRMYPEEFFKVEILVPPLSEQDAILAFISARTANLNASIKKVSGEVDLLREYRTRLIADVVTGKLDVREAAAKLPDTAVEPDEVQEQGPEELELEEEFVEEG